MPEVAERPQLAVGDRIYLTENSFLTVVSLNDAGVTTDRVWSSFISWERISSKVDLVWKWTDA